MTDQQSGGVRVDFPVAADGRRSTSAFGRAVIADALRATDPVGALGAEQETNWRSGYLTHFRRVIEAGLTSRAAALAIAADGLGAVRLLVAGQQIKFNARANEPLALGTRIFVIGVPSPTSVLVEPTSPVE